ncbi:MAG: hypothetical protein HY799_05380 [Nitrosomonadales bacterium]|nr:hypothetical protein [Nitrosomonadales bacterium]
MDPIVESILVRSAVIFLLVGSLGGVVIGGLLLWDPLRLRAVSGILNRWISTRHLDQSLELSVEIDPWFYRYRQASGVFILLGAGYILYFFTVSLDRAGAIAGLARHYNIPSSAVGVLLDAFVLCALLGAIFAAFVSLFLLLRPSLLRDFEQAANRWVSMRRALKPMEISRQGLDEYVFRHGRQAGALLVLGSLYVLVFLLSWLGH